MKVNNYSPNEIAPPSPEVPSNGGESTLGEDELSTLRSLLLGVEPSKLDKLYDRLDNPQIQSEDISRLLPEAVILRSHQDKQLAEAMVSTVEEAIQVSVKKDQNVLSEAFFPIIAPASRKAIFAVLEVMIQSLNQALEHSLSPQSLQWRLEARQTGKSFAEIVLLRTLVYRVEQVFLIHKHTGLLLQHLVAEEVPTQDPDLVSAMLTAIQDFVKDSFTVAKGDGLQSLQFGELTIWVEEGPQAVLAGIIQGKPPQELRIVFQQAIAKIHLKLSRELQAFVGDSAPFAASQPDLAVCLAARYKSLSKKNYTYAWTFLGIIAIASGIWGYFTLTEQQRWQSSMQKLDSQPGIVVINIKHRNGKYFISGLRDPLAVDPKTLIQQANLDSTMVISQWKPYLSLEPQFIATRAEKLLQPPKTVALKVDNNGVLHVSGYAPRQWISEVSKSWQFIPGVTQFDDQNLKDIQFRELELYKQQIEQQILLFNEGTTDFIPGEIDKLPTLVQAIPKLINAAKYLGKDVRVQITGHTNTTGTEQRNMALSQNRAQKILFYLSSQGINTSKFNTVGVGSNLPLHSESTSSGKITNRRVSFQIFITNPPN
ncbi:MAG: OmpA family protein [Gloeotrichia echinulata CP02]|nr:OmpA family protein [Gloeotrichia echinulata DEX184]